jgi:branched-chain amino acid transport system ATP-binding protein
MALLELRGVTKKFGGLVAVNNFDMDINEGEIRALIDPNGAGKTTAFNVITGYYPVTRGESRYEGKDITHLKPHEIAKRGLIRTFQLTTLFMEFTVLKGIMVARHLHAGLSTIQRALGTAGSRERENEAKSLEIIEFLGLGDFKYELACNLPHGHQRAVGIGLGSGY